jgi:hypothetical protein
MCKTEAQGTGRKAQGKSLSRLKTLRLAPYALSYIAGIAQYL